MKKKDNLIRRYAILLSIASIFVSLFGSFVLAASEPKGPNQITISASGRNTMSNGSYVTSAQAGNVTALVITETRITEAWQGYYGNITGTITLDDALNFTLYDWDLPDPTGEIYASNGTDVIWTKIYCMNVSGLRSTNGSPGSNGPGIVYSINGTQIELNFGVNATDRDGLNETFNDTYSTGSFLVGSTTIDSSDGCSMAHPFADENHNTDWQELLLSDNTSLIFTAIIRRDADSYQPGTSHTADFQMFVLENGHAGSQANPTNYYFYVELV